MIAVWLLLGLAGAQDLDAELLRAVSHRDGVDCGALYADRDADAVDTALVRIAETATSPPWAPMGAAGCLAGRLADSEPARVAALRWLSDPALPGLALVVVGQLEQVPAPVATPLVRAARARATSDVRFARLAAPALGRLPAE